MVNLPYYVSPPESLRRVVHGPHRQPKSKSNKTWSLSQAVKKKNLKIRANDGNSVTSVVKVRGK
jgi:hypothetical protein